MMATGIPLPGSNIDAFYKGVDSSSNMLSNIMKPILSREQMANQKAINEARLAQQMKAHLDNLAISKQTQARLGQMMPYQIQALQDSHAKADPNFKAKQFQQVMSQIQQMRAQRNQPGGMQGGQETPAPPQQQNLMSSLMNGQQMGGEMPQGASPIMPNAMQQMGQYQNMPQQMAPPSQAQLQQGFGDFTPDEQIALASVGIKIPKENALQGPARNAADLKRLKEREGENSEVFQNAKAEYDASIEAKKDLRDLRARTKAGLKPGEKEFFDETTGIPLGKEIPLTSKERESEEGNILFNELYPHVYKGAYPFSGEGSIQRLEQAASNYKNDPKARKLFDDYLLADKMLGATTVNEASTLKAGRTNRTYNMLKESLEAQDIPKVIKKLIKQYQIPASAQLKASMDYQKILSDARKKARKGTPATQKLFYDPEMQANHDQEKSELSPQPTGNKGTKVINGITYYPDGQGGWEHD